MNQDIGTIFKKFFKLKPKKRSLFGADPREDWKRVVISFLIINLLIIGWSGYLFWKINQGEIFEVASTGSVEGETATRNNLRKVMDLYDGRNKQFEELRLVKPIANDPAL